MQESYGELLKLLLPTIIVENFELTSYKTTEEVMHLYLLEINQIPKEFEGQKMESKPTRPEVSLMRLQFRIFQSEDIKFFYTLNAAGGIAIL
ncbi:hypothetical protein [Emticicia sp. BO119]|uniref:hypothetical protein n=1 Tax=Emticicia sp. BO119 TaxID=2757768 RepID=UPI001E42B135|nr:hypothetical protein [Emticicia sp. BO119]